MVPPFKIRGEGLRKKSPRTLAQCDEECHELPLTPWETSPLSVIGHWTEIKVLFLLGFADPIPIAHVPQAFLEVVLG